MTMPARRASKFCAQRRAASPHIFCLSLICYVIPGHIEPWPECQPEQLINIPTRNVSVYIFPMVYVLAAGIFSWKKNTPLDFLSMCVVDIVISKQC